VGAELRDVGSTDTVIGQKSGLRVLRTQYMTMRTSAVYELFLDEHRGKKTMQDTFSSSIRSKRTGNAAMLKKIQKRQVLLFLAPNDDAFGILFTLNLPYSEIRISCQQNIRVIMPVCGRRFDNLDRSTKHYKLFILLYF
jgi:hypothetical protein